MGNKRQIGVGMLAVTLFAAGCWALTTEPVRACLPRAFNVWAEMVVGQWSQWLYSETLWIRDGWRRWAWPF